jgi:DNA-binding transcriptional regulator YiaG
VTPEQIKELRATLGLSQSELAKEIGVKTNTVQHWECGIRNPSSAAQKSLEKLADNT